MHEFDGPGELGDTCCDDDDDIARFERQCAERARAEGLPVYGGDGDEDDVQSEEEEQTPQISRSSQKTGVRVASESGTDWQQKCMSLQEKLKRREAELSQVRSDLSMVKSEGANTGDPTVELKQRLLHLTKYNRRLQVTTETQKSKMQQMEAELRKPKEQAKKQAEEQALQNNSAYLGEGMEDWKQKYLHSSNKLQEARHELQDVRSQFHRHKKVLVKELGSDEALERALSTADDPAAAEWKGRAAQISQLQRQVKELREQVRKSSTSVGEDATADTPTRTRRSRTEPAAEKDRAPITQTADKRREELERLSEETEKLRIDAQEAKRKRDALKARVGLLEGQLKEMKGHVQTLMQKSENDDNLVTALRRQLGRGGTAAANDQDSGTVELLKQEISELQAQLERQAQIMLQLRQKSLASSVDAGSSRLGASTPSTPQGALVERVRYLEAENARQTEHINLLNSGMGNQQDGDLKEQMQLMEQQLAKARRENDRLRNSLQQKDGFPSPLYSGISENDAAYGEPSSDEGLGSLA